MSDNDITDNDLVEPITIEYARALQNFTVGDAALLAHLRSDETQGALRTAEVWLHVFPDDLEGTPVGDDLSARNLAAAERLRGLLVAGPTGGEESDADVS